MLLDFEQSMMRRMGLGYLDKSDKNQIDVVEEVKKIMIGHGKAVGPVWDWLTSIKGLGAGGLAAQLLAMIDYPAPFPGSYPEHCNTISKLWRYAGWGMRARC